jgi:hypothetical protein
VPSEIGIADLIKQAGLTVGCFYEEFESHETLVAEAGICHEEVQHDSAQRRS